MGNAAGAAHRIEEGACRHSPQDRRDPAMHLDRWDRVLVDQGDGHGLIPVHRTSSAFAETLSWPGRRVETTASRLLPIIPSGKRAVHTLQRFTPDTHYGRPKADPGENRDPAKASVSRMLDFEMP